MSDIQTTFISEPTEIPVNVPKVDDVLDQLITNFKDKPQSREKFEAIKALDQDAKTKWFLSQPEPDNKAGTREPVHIGCLIIVTVVTVIVVTGYALINGKKVPIKEEQEKEVEKEVCDPPK